jgi:membrane protease YdiL (CAAX protease family)
MEELAFRALLFKTCEESLGSWIALAIQATLFGALHLINPHATMTVRLRSGSRQAVCSAPRSS